MFAAAWCAAAAAWAGGAALSAAQARDWLMRMHAAAGERNYQGTLVVSADGQLSSSRLTHYCDGRETFERIEWQDGHVRRVLRHNDQVLTQWPGAKTARLEQRDAVATFPSLLTGGGEQLFERYEMRAEGSSRVAGHEAHVFLLQPRDGHRFAQRLWAERASGLLLRADVIAADGRVLEASAFTEVQIGIKPEPRSVVAAMKQLEGWRVERAAFQRTTLDAEGWALPQVAGFRQVSCVKRSLDPAADAAAPVLQTIYSDGLTHVSVFIEPLAAQRHRAGRSAYGATHTLMMPLGTEHWLTVMGDVPFATLKLFAAALERRR